VKRIILILVLLMLVVVGIFAQGFSMSAGGGFIYDGSFYNGIKFIMDRQEFFMGEQVMAFGFFGFFDATYVEAEVNFTYGILTFLDNLKGPVIFETSGGLMALGFSILSKYPFDLGRVKLFPLLGVDYNLVFLEIITGTGKSKIASGVEYSSTFDLCQFGILSGLGADFCLGGPLFLRAETMFHLRFPNKAWRNAANTLNVFNALGGPKTVTTFGMGPQVKIGLGAKFK